MAISRRLEQKENASRDHPFFFHVCANRRLSHSSRTHYWKKKERSNAGSYVSSFIFFISFLNPPGTDQPFLQSSFGWSGVDGGWKEIENEREKKHFKTISSFFSSFANCNWRRKKGNRKCFFSVSWTGHQKKEKEDAIIWASARSLMSSFFFWLAVKRQITVILFLFIIQHITKNKEKMCWMKRKGLWPLSIPFWKEKSDQWWPRWRKKWPSIALFLLKRNHLPTIRMKTYDRSRSFSFSREIFLVSISWLGQRPLLRASQRTQESQHNKRKRRKQTFDRISDRLFSFFF